ncbi:MAG: hypothetical protein MHPSP_003232, partial [Paramarteilia canceri]
MVEAPGHAGEEQEVFIMFLGDGSTGKSTIKTCIANQLQSPEEVKALELGVT